MGEGSETGRKIARAAETEEEVTEPIRIDRNKPADTTELAEFLRVVRRALLMICSYIEKKYGS